MFLIKPRLATLSSKSSPDLTVLLSTPRVGSTAVLMSMKQSGRVIFHEPGIRAYQRFVQNLSMQGKKEVYDTQPNKFPTFQSIHEALKQVQKDGKAIFIKEMIFAGKHYMEDPLFDKASFVFLLRAPEESIISNYKLYSHPIDSVIRDVMSQEESLRFCTRLKNMGRRVLFMKSEDLAGDPEGSIKRLCQFSGISFSPKMMQWDPIDPNVKNISEYFHLIPGWHEKAAQSTGFNSKHFTAIKRVGGEPTFEEIPEEHRQGYIDFYHAQKGYYQQLLSLAHADAPRAGIKSSL